MEGKILLVLLVALFVSAQIALPVDAAKKSHKAVAAKPTADDAEDADEPPLKAKGKEGKKAAAVEEVEAASDDKEPEEAEKPAAGKSGAKEEGGEATEEGGQKADGGEEAGSSEKAADAAAVEEAKAGKAEAPTIKTSSGKDDISVKGNCSKDIKNHCKGVPPGAAQLVNCITYHVKNEKSGNDANAVKISEPCRSEVRAFKIEMYKDLSMDKNMAAACKADIHKNCDDDFLYPEPGNIVACLREVNQLDKLSSGCKAQVLRAQMEAADDFKNDPQLNELCGGEAERLCKGVEPGEGRVQECLRAHREKLAWDCQAELFRQEVENADDIRLNVRLFQACLNDQRKYCADVKYGDARVKDCLEEHRMDPDFSPTCKTEFEKMMERRAVDFRLDSSLRKYCKNDITEICYPDAEDITDVANWDAKVIQCLQDYRDELKDAKCKTQVHKLTSRAAESLRFDKPLADACYSDRQKLCKDVPDGMAQVFLCLQEHSAELKDVCRSALFDELVRFAEDIDFKFPMKQACSKELTKFCKDVPQGHAAKVQCLQEKIDDTDMTEDCRKEINRDLKRSAEDYRLNYRLNKACFSDVSKLCAHACDKELEQGSVTCGGSVLKCLQQNVGHLESAACKKELFSFNKLMVRDPLQFDLPLQKACSANITTLCKDVSRDHARTLACLRNKHDKLSDECKAEELRFSIMEASDIRLTPTLMNACGQELQSFCKDVPPEGGMAFKCLQDHIEEVTMGAACQGEVNLQELRHASNYRLDVRVRTECEADVQKFCVDADKGEEDHALVLKCMVENYKRLAASCQSEVSYAVRMALWQYSKGAALTAVCDGDVGRICSDSKAKEINGVVVGVYGQCLVSAKRDKLEPECRTLVKLVAKEGGHAGGTLDQARLEETLEKIAQLQGITFEAAMIEPEVVGPEPSGLVLTGWMAWVAVGALVVVAVGVVYGLYARFFSPTRNYQMVLKSAPPEGV